MTAPEAPEWTWSFDEGEYFHIDRSFIWTNERPPGVKTLVICHMQERHEDMMRGGLIKEVQSEMDCGLYDKIIHIVSPLDGEKLIEAPLELSWVIWTGTEGEILVSSPPADLSRSKSAPIEIIETFKPLRSVSVCGGSYGGCLADMSYILNALGADIHMLGELVY